MRDGWTISTLGKACEIKPPKKEAKNKLSTTDLVSFVPMNQLGIRQKDLHAIEQRLLGKVAGSYTYFADGDVLLAKITPCFENGKLGIASNLTNGVGFGSSEFIVFRPTKKINPEYLFYFLSQDSFRNSGANVMTGAVGHKRVPKEFIESYPLPLPPLPEQKRIVAILDEAFAGIEKAMANTESNLANVRELFEKIVIAKIFGDLDKKGWQTLTVEQLAKPEKGSIRTGPFGSQLLHSEFVDDGVAVLGIDNVVKNEFTWGKRRYITRKKYKELKRYTIKPNDVLISIMGTCGRCAVVPYNIPLAINSKHLCCISLNQEKCIPDFLLAYFLYHPIARQFLESRAKGSIMSGLNMGIIKKLPVRLPAIENQIIIVRKVNELKSETQNLQSIYQQKLTALAELKQSLLQKAFSGELTADEQLLPAKVAA